MPSSGNLDIGRPGQQLLPGYVVKLLKTLKIPFGTDRTMNGVDVDPTIAIISHVIDCLGALRDINKVGILVYTGIGVGASVMGVGTPYPHPNPPLTPYPTPLPPPPPPTYPPPTPHLHIGVSSQGFPGLSFSRN
jgi:hypothetical protein